MAADHPAQKIVTDYVSTILQERFGERPESVSVTIEKPFILIHIQGFLMASEKGLLKRNEEKRVLETRDLLMKTLKADVKQRLCQLTHIDIEDIYADWNLEKETGLFIAVMANSKTRKEISWPAEVDKNALRKKIAETSEKTEKKPDYTELYWLSHHLIVIERVGIMVEIEKELIKNGAIDELRHAKRPLEHRLMDSTELSPILKRQVEELFVDWDFEKDKAYLVLVLKSEDL